ncbi:DUF2974 domain-containing protein [Variovorax sp. J22G73]|uniref:lipase family protein n=1 Tax=unclassified Variovorax TaxID=663243 RepID=UPI0025779440|nr:MULTISPECIES: DUF6792 domain-containing protein [unclassified Variovorax]MDM0009432.1 DUF2974 domain-containing protein [Variovorax sp. J22R203]MDM0101939.1 DUF2974 domain-containing protein [Variovorax sp. J22G73]
MNRGYWNRAARCAAALFFLVALSGCGAITSVREAMYYNSDMARKANDSLKECRATSSLEIRHPMDHRPASAEEPDCYSVVISTSSRALGDMSISPSASSGEYRGPMAPQEFGRASSAAAVLGQIAWPAVLSKIVYRRYAPEADRSDCNYEAGLHPLGRIPIAAAGRWESWETTGDGCKAIGGLFYETFIYRLRNGPVTQAFIVFRGTENYSGQALTDWSTNFAMAMNIEPSQFKDVRRNVKVIIARLRVQYPGVRIFTAGHSLGGSLAQLAAYVSKDIDIAYAFNTSPVSGWTALREQQERNPPKRSSRTKILQSSGSCRKKKLLGCSGSSRMPRTLLCVEKAGPMWRLTFPRAMKC